MAGSGAIGALTAWCAGIEPRQPGADPALVEKDQVLGRDGLDGFGKGGAFGEDIGAPLLARPERLFLRTNPRRWRVTQSTGRLTRTPVCACNWAAYSARLAWLSAATRWRRTSRSPAPNRGAGPRPSGLATRRPSLSAARTHFFTVLSATRNRRASAAAVPSPCS